MATPTRSLGAWIPAIIAVIACAVAWGATSATVLKHSDEIVTLKQTDTKITEILMQLDKNQALILQRLEALERRTP